MKVYVCVALLLFLFQEKRKYIIKQIIQSILLLKASTVCYTDTINGSSSSVVIKTRDIFKPKTQNHFLIAVLLLI